MGRNRMFFTVLTVALTVILCAACAGSGKEAGEKKPLTGEDDPEEVIAAANEQYGREKRRGSEFTYTYTYLDDTTDTAAGGSSVDLEKGIQQISYTDGGKSEVYSCSVKKGKSFYTYIRDTETGAWMRYEQTPDEEGKTAYEQQVEEGRAFYLFDEDYGYADVEYSNEGEEEIDGVNTVKIRMTGQDAADGEETEGVTRESILEEYELSEEAVGYVDGLSDALDRYVAAMNAMQNSGPAEYEACLWVEAESHRPLKSEMRARLDNTDQAQAEKDMADFEDNSWKAYEVQEELAGGASPEEALQHVKESEADMEVEIRADRELLEAEDEDAEDAKPQKQMETVEHYVYGEACAPIGELPEKYTEITQEEYDNGEY